MTLPGRMGNSLVVAKVTSLRIRAWGLLDKRPKGTWSAHLVVVLHKDATARKDSEEGIEVVGVCTFEPIHVQPSGATDWCRQDLKSWDRCAVCAFLTTDNEDTPIGHNHGGWVPATL
jgi:hypothetical protein